jgi:16S rRNA (adenine1518-N6/adenine1519-N6)-dimethyltransferase
MPRMSKGIRIKPNPKKGQHILKDRHIIKRQIEYAQLTGLETVLEIGPGMGALTIPLSENSKKVVAIELDKRFYTHLEDCVPDNVKLINADAMKVDFPDFDVVVSNLPYQISSPLTFKLLEYEFDRAILMYQKEFAQRMVAKAGDSGYSRLSVNVYYRAECKILEDVPRDAFEPPPEVDSAIVRLIPRSPPFSVKDEELFFSLIEALFSQRRKKIKNTVASFMERKMKVKNKEKIRDLTHNLAKSEDRVDSLEPEEIGALSNTLYNLARDTPH